MALNSRAIHARLRCSSTDHPATFPPEEDQFLEQEKETKRRRGRIPMTLPIRVHCRESNEYAWTERSRLVDVSHFGAGFTLTRPIEPGRVILLTIPMPHQLRCFDHTEPQYSVWSLVRHAAPLQKAQYQESTLFRVGVAFVGKRPPRSYDNDPTIRYEPLPIDSLSTMSKVSEQRSASQRRETRLIIPLEVVVEALDESGKPSLQEHTVTETMSSLGTCVPTTLDIGVGRIIRITSARDRVSIFAAIRSRKLAPDGIPRLGLEFLGERWPLHGD